MTYDSKTRRQEMNCPFCGRSRDKVLSENELAYAIHDAFPVTPLHTLVIPKRHVQSYFNLDPAELEACYQLLHGEKAAIEREDGKVQGFNVGVNDGETAGQTVFHCHIHLIPRRKHDVENPRGGVRNVPPSLTKRIIRRGRTHPFRRTTRATPPVLRGQLTRKLSTTARTDNHKLTAQRAGVA